MLRAPQEGMEQDLSDTHVHRMLRLLVFGAALTVIGTPPALPQSAMRDLYVEAAAVAEKCGVPMLGAAGEAKLAAVIAAETKEQVAAADIAQLLAKARAAYSGTVDCDGPLTSIHVQFFKNVLLPRMEGQNNAPPRPAP